MDAKEFLAEVDKDCKTQLERALALLWFIGRDDQTVGMSARDIADVLRSTGHAQQNVSRLNEALSNDRRTVVAKTGGWALKPSARRDLNSAYSLSLGPKPLPQSDSVIPMSLIFGSRGYIERVGDQVNKSYDGQLYDCCAVMCRRLLETLIIEIYEHLGRSSEIRVGKQFFGFSELITHLENDANVYLSAPAMRALKELKRLGDLSAHNRQYNARQSDIEPHRSGIRLLVEEMLYKANLHPGRAAA